MSDNVFQASLIFAVVAFMLFPILICEFWAWKYNSKLIKQAYLKSSIVEIWKSEPKLKVFIDNGFSWVFRGKTEHEIYIKLNTLCGFYDWDLMIVTDFAGESDYLYGHTVYDYFYDQPYLSVIDSVGQIQKAVHYKICDKFKIKYAFPETKLIDSNFKNIKILVLKNYGWGNDVSGFLRLGVLVQGDSVNSGSLLICTKNIFYEGDVNNTICDNAVDLFKDLVKEYHDRIYKGKNKETKKRENNRSM